MLPQHEADVTTAELCTKHGNSDALFYNPKDEKIRLHDRAEAALLPTLEVKNICTKYLSAESMLYMSALQ